MGCVVYILTSGLSPFLLVTRSGVSILPKNKGDKICTAFVCFLSILTEVVPQLSKNWFTVLLFMVNLAWFCDVLLHFWSGEDPVSPLIVVFWPFMVEILLDIAWYLLKCCVLCYHEFWYCRCSILLLHCFSQGASFLKIYFTWRWSKGLVEFPGCFAISHSKL